MLLCIKYKKITIIIIIIIPWPLNETEDNVNSQMDTHKQNKKKTEKNKWHNNVLSKLLCTWGVVYILPKNNDVSLLEVFSKRNNIPNFYILCMKMFILL